MKLLMRNGQVRRLSLEGLWVILGQVGMIVGTLFGVRVLTELLTPAAYGELALLMTIVSCTNLVCFGPVCNGVGRFFSAARESGQLSGYFAGARQILLWCGGTLLVLAVLGAAIAYRGGLAAWLPAGLAALGVALVSGVSTVVTSMHNAARRRGLVAAQQALDAVLRPAVATALLVSLGRSVFVTLTGYAAAAAGLLIWNYSALRRADGPFMAHRESIQRWRTMILRYSWPIGAWGVFTWAQQASSRWSLDAYATPEDVGRFVLLYQFGAYPMVLFGATLTQLASPIIFQRVGDASNIERVRSGLGFVAKISGLVLIVSVIACVGAAAFHQEIFHYVIARRFTLESNLLPWAVASGGALSIGQTISIHLMSTMKTHLLAYAKIVTAVLGVAFNVAGARLFGLKGVVIGDFMFSATYLGAVGFLVTYHVARTGAAARSEAPL